VRGLSTITHPYTTAQHIVLGLWSPSEENPFSAFARADSCTMLDSDFREHVFLGTWVNSPSARLGDWRIL